MFIFVKQDKVLDPDIKTFMYTVGILQFGCIIDQYITTQAILFPSLKVVLNTRKKGIL